MPGYAENPDWKDEDTREHFINLYKLRFLESTRSRLYRAYRKL